MQNSSGSGVGGASQSKSYASDNDPPCLLKARNRYEELSQLISNLGPKLSQVTSMHEKEFLSAYRVHMLNVQLELRELKLRVSKAEENLQDDDVVSKLEEECNWFRNEKNRLQQQVSTMDKDKQHMKTRLASLKEQRAYLNSQLKAITKRSRILETEISMTNQNNDMAPSNQSQFGPDQSAHSEGIRSRADIISGGEEEESLDSSRRLSRADQSVEPSRQWAEKAHPQHKPGNKTNLARSLPNLHGHKANHFLSQSGESGPSFHDVRGGPDAFLGQGTPQKKKIKHKNASSSLLRSLSQSSKGQAFTDTNRTASLLQEFESSRGPCELALEDTVRAFTQAVIERRAYSSHGDRRDRTSGSASREAGVSAGGLVQQRRSLVAEASHRPLPQVGVTGLGIEHFTETDRLAVMTTFLSRPEVFPLVVDFLLQEQSFDEGNT